MKTTTRRLAIGLAVPLLLGVAVLGRSRGQDGPGKGSSKPSTLWITEIDTDADTGQAQLLLNVGRDAGVDRGDVLDVEREGRKIARATIVASYPDVAMATVDQVEKGVTVARGDWLRPRTKSPRRNPPPAETPLAVTSVDAKGTIHLAGTEIGCRAELEAVVERDGKPVGRIRLTARTDTWEATLVEGEAKPGDHVQLLTAEHGKEGEPELSPEELRRLRREAEGPKGVDFVAMHFLGVVGELEHPVRTLAPCHMGVLVRRIVDGSPAEKAKIRAGDRVIAIDDRIVRTPSDIFHGVKRRAGDTVKVTLVREDMLQTVIADFTKR